MKHLKIFGVGLIAIVSAGSILLLPSIILILLTGNLGYLPFGLFFWLVLFVIYGVGEIISGELNENN